MKLARINDLLLSGIIIVNGYIIAAPFLPQLTTWWQLDHTNKKQQLQKLVQAPISKVAPVANHVVIPDMGLDAPIGEGAYGNRYAVLHSGIWRYSYGSTPDRGSNTVLVGHRFTYTNPRGIFYALDKVHVGSEIAVFWNNKKYVYKVSETKVVDPAQVDIQSASKDSELTLFTCTPLFHPTSRLVVVAKEES